MAGWKSRVGTVRSRAKDRAGQKPDDLEGGHQFPNIAPVSPASKSFPDRSTALQPPPFHHP